MKAILPVAEPQEAGPADWRQTGRPVGQQTQGDLDNQISWKRRGCVTTRNQLGGTLDLLPGLSDLCIELLPHILMDTAVIGLKGEADLGEYKSGLYYSQANKFCISMKKYYLLN